jgi:hypothetical protein
MAMAAERASADRPMTHWPIGFSGDLRTFVDFLQ